MLLNWNKSHSQQTFIDKKEFPHLLVYTLIEMNNKSEDAIKENLMASFQATGAVPLDPERVWKKIPGEGIGNDADGTETVLVNYL
nr:unnamed protein product [Callosobruchus analis]